MSRESLKKLNRQQLLVAQKQAALLVHDLGKQLTRAARNLPESDIPRPLVDMMIKDLFDLKGNRSGQQVFRELATPLCELIDDPRLDRIRVLIDRVEQRESLIRIGDQEALRETAAMAIEIETLLRGLAEEINEACR